MEEKQIHRNLFEKYLYLLHAGKNKTEAIKEVAKKEGYSESAIWKYKRTFNWDEREIIRSKEINKKTEEKANETIADMKVEFMGNYRIIIRQWMEKLRLNEIPVEKISATEIVRLTESYLKLGGEEMDIIKGEFEVKESGSEIPKEFAKEFGNFLLHRRQSGGMDTVSFEEQEEDS